MRMRVTRLIGIVTLGVASVATPYPQAGGAEVCTGDCDHNGVVTVDEIVEMVNISLMSGPDMSGALNNCSAADRNGDGRVSVDEIITGIRDALNGCPTVSVQLGATSVAQGATAEMAVSVSGDPIVALQQDIVFPEEDGAVVVDIPKREDGSPDCTSKDTDQTMAFAAFFPAGCDAGSCDATGCGANHCKGIRLTYSPLPKPGTTIEQILNSVIYSCTVRAAQSATTGVHGMSCANVTAVYETAGSDPACTDKVTFYQRTADCVAGTVQVTPASSDLLAHN